ncbi:hypothetical protein FB446DRAFT_788626 [Lentinula raphanica]|nr:hypothetical protein FB446DRAFT_788626 [Lentinula raphanica]
MRAKAYIALAILQLQLAITHALPTVPQVEVPQSEGSQSEESQSRKDVVVIDARGYQPQSFPDPGSYDLYTSPGPGDYYRHPVEQAHNHDALRPDSSVPPIHTIPEHTRWRYTVTTPPNNPYNYVVFTYNYDINHLPTELRFWTDVRMFLNDHWFLRPEVKAALGLRNPPEFGHFHPNTVHDYEYVHFSIVGHGTKCGQLRNRRTRELEDHLSCRALVERDREGYWIKSASETIIAFQPSDYSISTAKLLIPMSHSKNIYFIFSNKEGRRCDDPRAAGEVIERFSDHAGLGLRHESYTYISRGCPDQDFDADNLIVSIIGPRVCKGVCRAAVNRMNPESKFWVQDDTGKTIRDRY